MRKHFLLLALLAAPLALSAQDSQTAFGREFESLHFQRTEVPMSYDKPVPIDSNTGKVTWKEVVNVQGAGKNQLYHRAHQWAKGALSGTQRNISVTDSAGGVIVGKGNTRYEIGRSFTGSKEITVFYTVRIEAKNGKYRYIISDIYYGANYGMFNPKLEADNTSAEDWITLRVLETNKSEERHKRRALTAYSVETVITSIKMHMQAPANAGKKEDW